MMWLTENIQVCLRIFRRTQHQWLSRDVLHQPQGVFTVFVLHPVSASQSVLSEVEKKNLSSGWYPTTGRTATCKAKRFISVYRLGEDGDLLKEGGGMLLVWALRACSYKTKAEA